MAEAWLLRDDVTRAASVLGRPPDVLRERMSPSRLSAMWRLHGRIASLRGDQSRAIALLGRAARQAELALDSRAIGLAHYELGRLLPAGRRPVDRPGAPRHGDLGAQRRGRPPLPRAVPLADGHRVRADRPARRGDGGAAPGRAPRHGGRRRGRAGPGVRQPGQRRPDAAPPRPGAGARRARRLAARARGLGPRTRRGARLARPDLRPDRRPAPRRDGRSGARSRSEARCSSTRRPAPCSTRSRRSTSCAATTTRRKSACSRRARRTAPTGCRRAGGTSGRCDC